MARSACPRRRHGAAAVLTRFASAVHADSIDSIRCSNSYKAERDPPVANNNLDKSFEECEFQCNLFSTMDACDWFIYYLSGPSENCKLYGPGQMKMETWLASIDPTGEPVKGCPATIDEEQKCVTPEGNRYPDAGLPPMNFAVADCSPKTTLLV